MGMYIPAFKLYRAVPVAGTPVRHVSKGQIVVFNFPYRSQMQTGSSRQTLPWLTRRLSKVAAASQVAPSRARPFVLIPHVDTIAHDIGADLLPVSPGPKLTNSTFKA